jgi:AraC-like DNA-binding protein
MPFPVKTPVETLLAQTDTVAIGTFACAAEDPLFRDSGPSSTYCFAFPRTHVWIHNDGDTEFLSGPSVATFYNQGQVYRRRKASARGDRCDWCAVSPDVIEDALAELRQPRRGSRILFAATHVATAAGTYAAQRLRFERAARRAVEPLEVEETTLALMARLLSSRDGSRARAAVTPRQRDLVSDAKLLLARAPDRRVQLSELARELGCSVFHLCRIFRFVEGTSLAAYHVQLRVRLALEHLAGDRGADLAGVALDYGFSSHSHFTAAFRRAFGVTPSQFRAGIR